MDTLMNTVSPHDVLPEGTRVSIKNKQGTVIGNETVNAVPDGTIVVHTIRLTHKKVLEWGKTYKLVELPKPELWRGNYSAIQVLS